MLLVYVLPFAYQDFRVEGKIPLLSWIQGNGEALSSRTRAITSLLPNSTAEGEGVSTCGLETMEPYH